MCRVAWLSQNKLAGVVVLIWRSWRRNVSYCSSHAVVANALYSASDEKRDNVLWFFVFQDINDDPMKIQYPVVDFRVISHEAQSESLKALNFISFSLGKKMPRDGDPLMYLRTRLGALWCWTLGACTNLLRNWTLKLISGLVLVRYNSLPMIQR